MEILKIPMFQNIEKAEWEEMMAASCMRRCRYEKHAVILHAGRAAEEIGIVADGSVNIENTDLWGNKSILSHVSAGQVFAETYVFCREPMMVDVVAAASCEILFLNWRILMDGKYAGRAWYHKMLKNMLEISARKNLILSSRIFCTASKTIRGRLLTYLSSQAAKCGSTSFRIPFNRQQLADYLNLDRSALSKELCRMRDEGMLEFHKNEFKLVGE